MNGGRFQPEPIDEIERKFGAARAEAGRTGESFYARALSRAGITKDYHVVQSLGVPGLSTDVDIVIASLLGLVLIDAKKWKQATYWSLPDGRFPMKDLRPHHKDGEWRLSRNMEAAVERYSAAVPHVRVTALVAFVPTTKDDLTSVPNVRFLRWPGGIRSFSAGESFSEIRSRLPAGHPPDPKVTRFLTSLKKR